MGHQLLCNLLRERRIESASNVDRSQFLVLALVISFELRTLTLKFRLFGIGLRVHGHVLTSSH